MYVAKLKKSFYYRLSYKVSLFILDKIKTMNLSCILGFKKVVLFGKFSVKAWGGVWP